jgi:transposase
VHAVQILRWKKLAQESLPQIFSGKLGKCNHDELIEKLYRNIGEITVENDWIKKKLGL